MEICIIKEKRGITKDSLKNDSELNIPKNKNDRVPGKNDRVKYTLSFWSKGKQSYCKLKFYKIFIGVYRYPPVTYEQNVTQ